MKTTVDYSKSPAKAFDAVEDVKNWFGDCWPQVNDLMKSVDDVKVFGFYANFADVEGYPVEAWYDLYHGQGAYARAVGRIES